jgi:hypothetical protein
VGEAVIFAMGAGATTGGAVGAGGGATFFLQPAKANKATNSTTRDKIRIGRSNELLLQQKSRALSRRLDHLSESANATPPYGTPLQVTMVLAVIDQERTKVEVDPILCAERRCRRSNNAAISYARRTKSLSSVNNILNQAVRRCVFLLEHPSHSLEGVNRRCFALAFPIMDELACFQYLSGKISTRMETANGDGKQKWI